MKYVNQLQHRHIPYRTHTKDENMSEKDKMRDVARAGCGPCSICMVVEALTNYSLPIEDCIVIAEECEANYGSGTDMGILAPVIAEKYKMEYRHTNDLDEVVDHLQKGGQAVVLVGVPEGKEIGLFTKWGHFMVLVSTDGKDFCILDPSYTEDKYEIPQRKGLVDTSHAPYLYCDIHRLHEEVTFEEGKRYYLFARKR